MTATLDDVMAVVLETHAEVTALRLLIEARTEGPVASEAEITSNHGDPIARFDPAGWRGATGKGKRYSECEADYLDALARALTQMAAKDDAAGKQYKGRPAGQYGRQNAARARRWALRKRMGWTPPKAPATGAAAPKAPAVNPFAPKSTGTLGISPFDREHGDAWEDWEAPAANEEPDDEEEEEDRIL